MASYPLYLEIGKKKSFAGALDWPGWGRSIKAPEQAAGVLLAYAPRYTAALRLAGVDFEPPASADDLVVAETYPGSSGTDFGVPEVPVERDRQPAGEDDLPAMLDLLEAGWLALAGAARAAEGRELRKGPRGGGRELEQIIRHVTESNSGYLSRLGQKLPPEEDIAGIGPALIEQARLLTREALERAVREGIPAQGPRGGKMWTARYYLRRAMWHILDHAWEIEDRIT